MNLPCLRKVHTLIRNSSCFTPYKLKTSALTEICKLKFIYHSHDYMLNFFSLFGETLKLISVILLEEKDVDVCFKFFITNLIIRFYFL